MTNLRKAAEQALEALEGLIKSDNYYIETGELDSEGVLAINALRQALAEPTWHCPLKKPDCKENCGSYGCGN